MRTGFAAGARQYFDRTGRFFTPGIGEGTGYAASLQGQNDAWVTLHIRTDDVEQTNRIFDELHAAREEIEAEFTELLGDREQTDADATAPQWSWRRYDRWAFHSISIRRDGAIHDPPEELEEIRAWMLGHLPRLKAVFDARVERSSGGCSRATAIDRRPSASVAREHLGEDGERRHSGGTVPYGRTPRRRFGPPDSSCGSTR